MNEPTPEAKKHWTKELARRRNFKPSELVKRWQKGPFNINAVKEKYYERR